MRWGLLLVLTAALVLPGNAGAVVFPGSPQPYQRWADEAKVPTVLGELQLIQESCPGHAGRACAPPGAVYIDGPGYAAILYDHWTRVDAVRELRATVLHELGHHLDYTMPEWVRTRFVAIMDDPRPWRTSPNPPQEQFAVAYSRCGLGGLAARRLSRSYDYRPTVAQGRAVCSLIRGLRFPGLRRNP